MGCSGNCGSCDGCAKELVLAQQEIDILLLLGQYSFLPVARKAEDMTPVCLEADWDMEAASLALQLLEKKGLVDLDYTKPLPGADMSAYGGYPVHGSVALTARGQAVQELLEIYGTTENAD